MCFQEKQRIDDFISSEQTTHSANQIHISLFKWCGELSKCISSTLVAEVAHELDEAFYFASLFRPH